MNQKGQFEGQDSQDVRDVSVSKGKLDLIVLKYMARRMHLTLHQLGEPISTSQPLLYRLQERYGRTHRIAIYKYQELFLEKPFAFVGFFSRKQRNLRPSIVRAIETVDKKLIEELVGSPGILSYSSLELRNGNWCNLVLLSEANAKTYIKSSETHRYAAYQLANRYYEWIRLHNGIMPEGLDHTEMMVRKTKYYTFQRAQERLSIQELTYAES
jgi:hypothetical protein